MKSPRSQQQWDDLLDSEVFAKRDIQVKNLSDKKKKTIWKHGDIHVVGYGDKPTNFLANTIFGMRCYINWKDVEKEEDACCGCPIHCFNH